MRKITEQEVCKTPELALLNMYVKENRELKGGKLIGFMLTTARQLIAGNWKTARMLTVSLWEKKIWNIAINEKLTQKLRTHTGIKKRDTFRTDWQKYIDCMKNEPNRTTLAEAYRNLWDS